MTTVLEKQTMPHFNFETDGNGLITAIYRDGVLQEGTVRLALPNSVVKSYFTAALRSFHGMRPDAEAPELRNFGLQSFLMSLTGLEAFLNVYFYRRGHTTGPLELITRADERRPVEHKLSHLPRLAFGSNLPDQRMLNRKVRELYNLRSSIVHPRIALSSMFFEGIAVSGMVQISSKPSRIVSFVARHLGGACWSSPASGSRQTRWAMCL